jgi:hypothetical protein
VPLEHPASGSEGLALRSRLRRLPQALVGQLNRSLRRGSRLGEVKLKEAARRPKIVPAKEEEV